jgi:ankyrin repeat protein
LLEAGADVHALTSQMTPLHFAAALGHGAVVGRLCKHGADTEALDGNGATPLELAVKKGHLSSVKALLQAGADAEKHSESTSCTSLWTASFYGHVAIVDALLAHGVEVDTSCTNGTTALLASAMQGNDAVMKTLLKAGADGSILNCGPLPTPSLYSSGMINTGRTSAVSMQTNYVMRRVFHFLFSANLTLFCFVPALLQQSTMNVSTCNARHGLNRAPRRCTISCCR